MHAVVVRVNIKDAEGGVAQLRERVVPAVSQAPGFVAGWWTQSDDRSNGMSLVVFESEEGARAMADRIKEEGPPIEEVTLESVEVRTVVANA